MQEIKLNVIPFTPAKQQLTFAFYEEYFPGSVPIRWNKLFKEFPKDREAAATHYYTDFQPAKEGAVKKTIDVYDAITFTKKYYHYLIASYFKNIDGVVLQSNFVKDTEVWIEDKKQKATGYRIYNKFTLKVQYKTVVENGYELLVAYNGTSKISSQSIADIPEFNSDNYTKVLQQGVIYNYKNIEPAKKVLSEMYPVINYELKKHWDVEEEWISENRYPVFNRQLDQFYATYLSKKDFLTIIPLCPKGFYRITGEKIFKTSKDANLLKFQQGTGVNPWTGILKYRPLEPSTKTVKMFFIYHVKDGPMINETFYNFMEKGWDKPVRGKAKSRDSFRKSFNQDYFIDKTRRICFTNTDTLFEEVGPAIKELKEDPENNWVALYFSPIPKDDKEHPHHRAYHRMKELLLEKGITLQVLYTENLSKEDFYYFLPNIYVALLGKMGAVPWSLATDNLDDEVVIGVGAYKPQDSPQKFVGSAFCFDKSGLFEGFNCFRQDETVMLAGSIREAVEAFISENKDPKKIVIHFYKDISEKKELQPILEMLEGLCDREIPVVVVTVNKTDSRELIGFDTQSPAMMPVSGTYLRVGYNDYLLFNNTRYSGDERLNKKDYHFPIKLSFRATKEGILNKPGEVKKLVNQVYQFSRMYWKSVSQQNLPVTVSYPAMVAEIYPYFEHEEIPEFGRKSLWFL